MRVFLKYSLYIAFFVALTGTVGSLFFSEVLKFPPCVLCWYQRICMYPLVPILGVGIYSRDRQVYRYVFPLAIVGLLIALYHNLLYYKLLPEYAAPCQAGVSCTTKYVEFFGFITIPFLSLVAFAIILLSMLLYFRQLQLKNRSRKEDIK